MDPRLRKAGRSNRDGAQRHSLPTELAPAPSVMPAGRGEQIEIVFLHDAGSPKAAEIDEMLTSHGVPFNPRAQQQSRGCGAGGAPARLMSGCAVGIVFFRGAARHRYFASLFERSFEALVWWRNSAQVASRRLSRHSRNGRRWRVMHFYIVTLRGCIVDTTPESNLESVLPSTWPTPQ